MNAEFVDMGIAYGVNRDSPQGIYWVQASGGRGSGRLATGDGSGFAPEMPPVDFAPPRSS